jgi:hypothetical protein
MIDASLSPIHSEHAIAQSADKAWIVFHIESGEYYSLDEVGGRIWQLCDGAHTVSQIIDTLSGEYDATRTDLHADVMELVGALEKEGLIDVRPAPVPGAE